MNSLILAIFAGALIYFVIRLALSGARLIGEAEQRAKDAEIRADIAIKQGEVMAEDRTPDETADRLDNGSF